MKKKNISLHPKSHVTEDFGTDPQTHSDPFRRGTDPSIRIRIRIRLVRAQ
jgi:hypothetical protein